ncbi:TetR family transcriptional regulator [Microlunatus elymi]|uniref:TetR family transcriptional regulator n=1 Tax=Microlunatus elymi TaxID=2596828 RepID=A0A516PYH8_9ACTN|nr:TetR/AcrR family transcriptional regulator C-terminal domain-containing protein [Microlunatus elymi]QDP96227.1 TetR family transcriptional regulator [Microlunatus elymi]
MRLTRESVLDGAFAILDRYGLADLTMRRLATELGVQPGGLYWHFANKQTLLAAMATAISESAAEPEPTTDTGWRLRLERISSRFRTALLQHRDGAELVAAGYALHPGAGEPLESMIKILQRAGLDPDPAYAAAGALTHFVLGHAAEVQSHDQLRQAGALPPDQERIPDPEVAFRTGLSIFLDGLAVRLD